MASIENERQRINNQSIAIGSDIANIHADRTNVDTEIAQFSST